MEKINDILELIKSRRSITKYLPKAIPWEYVSRIVDAARHAPSCGNVQNWKFIVVLSPEKRKAIAEAAIQQYWMISAPVHIIVCAMPEMAERYYGVRGERLYTVQNCAAAVENILLEAHSLGLGACWIGAFDEDMLKRSLGAEENIRPQAIVTVGYPAEIPPKPPKMPMNVVTNFERWRGVVRDPLAYFRDYALIWQREFAKGKQALKDAAEKIKEKLKKRKEAMEKEEPPVEVHTQHTKEQEEQQPEEGWDEEEKEK
ncbi:MAG TPA: nitroreductase family protein [Candidatus Nanoarchaeia archaeon]|nr:nitroreductase family protein [Candidatus Nanoarchaeia archaeon]